MATSPNGNPDKTLGSGADVEDSVESVKTASWVNGERAITLSVQRQPGANTVATVDAVKAAMPALVAQMPSSVQLKLTSDRSISIRESIHDVQVTLAITIALVLLVIFLFLRKASATLIPALSLPISLLGTVAMMRCARLQPGQYFAAGDHACGRLGGGRCDRDAGEYRAPYREGHAALAGGVAGLKGSQLHHHVDFAFAGGGVHSDLLHAGRDRPAFS